MASEYCKFPHCECSMGAAERCKRIRTRPTPTATDTGLVTVAWRYRDTWEGARKYWKFFERHLDLEDAEIQALCLRSQAEELLAAERAEAELWKKKAEFLAEKVSDLVDKIAAKDKLIQSLIDFDSDEVKRLEAKLAAAREAVKAAMELIQAYNNGSELTNAGQIMSKLRAVLKVIP